MSQTRKSSVDNVRRGVPKAHIPYRADDLTHGKKTGINVKVVDRRSDGFESFGEVLGQADVVTPPNNRTKKGARRSTSPVADYDENGEMSMELDDPNTDSPNAYFNSASRPSAPTSANRSTTSSHALNRSSYVDYDQVPSPRPSSSSLRQRSQPNGASTPTSRYKSHLSEAVIPSSPEETEKDDSFGDMLGNDAYDPPAPDSSSPVRRTSFTEMDQDEDDNPQVPDHPPVSSPPERTHKGKGKELPEDDDQVEEEIAQGLEKLSNGRIEEEEGGEEEEEPTPKPKKRRGNDEDASREKKAANKRKRVQIDVLETRENAEGVRRGTRTRYKPLEWWRCEKVVYGRRDSGISMVPVIKDIIRLPKEDPEPLGVSARKRSKKPNSRIKAEGEDRKEVMVFNPEEGWDDETDPHGIVMDYSTHDEVRRRVAFTARMVTPKAASNNDFSFQKIFGDGEFIAAGQLILPVGGRKPSKGTKDNTYVFYIIEGAIKLRIHRTSFVLATGGSFLIPRGNNYYLENISQRPAKLFFAQARKVNAEDEPLPDVQPASALRKSADSGRRVSFGHASSGAKSASVARSSSVTGTSSPVKKVDLKSSLKRAISK